VREAWFQLGRRRRLMLCGVAAGLALLAFVLLAVRHEVGEAMLLVGGGFGLVVAVIAGRLLDEAFARQRRFVSDASHELRTPLTAIRGQLEVLARSEHPEAGEVRRVERVVLGETARLEGLVDDMLRLARLDEEAPLRVEAFDLPGYLVELGRTDSPPTVKLGAVPAGTLRADPEQLTGVLRNLLANARRHAGEQGRVELSAVARGARLTIRVDDDGPGIPAEERERVFDRFHRSEAARERESGGSGLGLAIAKAVAERHGGRIRAEESPLGGARLALELPGFEPRASAQLGTA
jgi:two-component system, OmpR family, sensor kinase